MRARPPSQDNSGYVRSFRRRTSTKTVPSWSAARGLADPSRRSSDTKVVSIPSCCGQPTPRLAQGFSWRHGLLPLGTAVQPHTPVENHRTPATAHAARWWPNRSSWRPHRQSEVFCTTEDERLRVRPCGLGRRQSGQWCRRQGAVLRPDNTLSVGVGQTASRMNLSSTFLEALCCHGVFANSSHGGFTSPGSARALWH